MKSILISTIRGPITVLESDIIRIEASSNYSKIYFSNERPLIVAKVLHLFQDMLTKDSFCRIHRAHLINRSYVIAIIGRSKVELSNGEVLQISKRKKNYAGQLLLQSA
ncbi:MAG: LytTR family DNA-binding domain-containing protein [Ferruginibacter sp.]